METNNETKLSLLGGLIRRLREENRRLREENAVLRGQKSREQEQADREDAEVFRLARGEVKGTGGTWITIRR